MTDLAPEEKHVSPDLLHLLTCSTCRNWIIGRLLDRRTEPAEEEDTRDERYAAMWARLEERTPELIEEGRRRAEMVDQLFAELMQAPPGRRLGMIQQARFRSLDLLERLLEREAGACLLLLGLVLLEEARDGEALALLAHGWNEMDRDTRPLLALQGGLALAASLAQTGDEERARRVLKQSWQLFAEVSEPAEMLRVYAWEGRVLACLGDRDEALHVLESVRRQLLAEPSPAEAALVSLDLALVLAESCRAEEIEALAEELRSSFPEIPTMLRAAQHLSAVGILAREGEPRLREATFKTAITLRRMFRACGLRIKPLPFA
jgi:tetratricopeptide (TPR) repeat protein